MNDAVIVGGGIGGAVLALALARAGRTAVVLERTTAPPRAGRPEILWPATIEALDGLGVGDSLRAEAVVPIARLEVRRAGEGLDAEPVVTLGEGSLRHASDPVATRAVLLAAAEATGRVHVRRGVDAQSIEVDGAGALVEGVRAAVVVGDDGGASRVREALGIALTTQAFPVEFAGTDLAADEVDPALGRAWVDPDALDAGLLATIAIPLPRRRVAVVLVLAPGAWDALRAAGPEGFRARVEAVAPSLAGVLARVRFPEDLVHVRRPVGHAARYVADRAALLGDAAHPMSPAGGQGANASVADALVLAEVLRDALAAGDLSAASLARYETLRRPANERSLAFSRRGAAALRTMRAFPPAKLVAAAGVAVLRRSPSLRRRLVEAFATAFTGAT